MGVSHHFFLTARNSKNSLNIDNFDIFYFLYRGKGSNLHTLRAPDPKSGVSTNSTTAAYL